MVVLAGSVCGHSRHDFRRNPAHILADNFGDMATRTGTGFHVLRQNAPRVFFGRDALRKPLGVQCGLLLVPDVLWAGSWFLPSD
jgi:hypothetical protein